MGRKKGSKNGTSSVVPYRDYNLIKRIKSGDKSAEYELFNLYSELIYSQYHILREIIVDYGFKGFELPDIKDYKANCWEPFVKAVNTTELNKIDHCPVYDCKKESKETLTEWRARRQCVGYEDHSEKWCFYQTFWGYIKKMNETNLAHFVKERGKDIQMISSSSKDEEFNIIDVAKSYDNSCETEYLEKKENLKLRIAINNSLKRFTPLQKKIWDSRAQEESEYNFVKTNKVSKKEYEANLEAMKKIYDFELRKLND